MYFVERGSKSLYEELKTLICEKLIKKEEEAERATVRCEPCFLEFFC